MDQGSWLGFGRLPWAGSELGVTFGTKANGVVSATGSSGRQTRGSVVLGARAKSKGRGVKFLVKKKNLTSAVRWVTLLRPGHNPQSKKKGWIILCSIFHLWLGTPFFEFSLGLARKENFRGVSF